MGEVSASNEVQSCAVHVDALDFRYVDQFQNQSALKATAVENRGQI